MNQPFILRRIYNWMMSTVLSMQLILFTEVQQIGYTGNCAKDAVLRNVIM